MSDIGAYAFGNLVGGAKIWSEISPKKTVSGTVGGIFLGTLTGFFLKDNVITALVIATATQAGDLLESYSKRRANLKDSDVIIYIPGHGGILDRIDGLLLATPFYVILNIK